LKVFTGIPLYNTKTAIKATEEKEVRVEEVEDFYQGQTVTEIFKPKENKDEMKIFVKSANMRAL